VKNIWLIFRKELRSYFTSPIAYTIMALYALIFGFFFYNATKYFQQVGMQAQMMGRSFPMNINEIIVRPVLMNTSVIGLFLIPMICMRLFAEEKRSGTIELLMTSPVRDIEVILGKWLAALALYATILLVSAVNLTFLFAYGKPDWRPILIGYLGLLLQAGALLAIGAFISTLTKNQIIAAALTFSRLRLIMGLHEYFSGNYIFRASLFVLNDLFNIPFFERGNFLLFYFFRNRIPYFFAKPYQSRCFSFCFNNILPPSLC